MLSKFLNKENDFFFSDDVSVDKTIPGGVYEVNFAPRGELYLSNVKIESEKFVKLQDKKMMKLFDTVSSFLTDKTRMKFKERGLLYKRGIMMYGPPGTGKTTIINQLIKICCEEKNMVAILNPPPERVKYIVDSVRQIEKRDRSFIVVWEEFESVVHSREKQLLQLLDGLEQVDNIVYVATTNYIDEVPARIKNRPSRFADLIEIDLPSEEARYSFLKSKLLPGEDVNVAAWAKVTEGFSIDHLKDLIISVLIFGNSFEESLEKIKNMPSDDKKKNSGGEMFYDSDDAPEDQTEYTSRRR